MSEQKVLETSVDFSPQRKKKLFSLGMKGKSFSRGSIVAGEGTEDAEGKEFGKLERVVYAAMS